MLAALLGMFSLFATAQAQARTPVWEAILAVQDGASALGDHGCQEGSTDPVKKCSAALSPGHSLSINGKGASVNTATVSTTGYLHFVLRPKTEHTITVSEASAFRQANSFCVGTTAFPLSSAQQSVASGFVSKIEFQQSGTALRWSPGDEVKLTIDTYCTELPPWIP